jgi:hypothetical protein
LFRACTDDTPHLYEEERDDDADDDDDEDKPYIKLV